VSEEFRTPDLVEILRHGTEALNRRDLDAFLSLQAPDAVWDFTQRGVGTFEGSAAMRGFLNDYWGSFDDLVFEIEETRVLDNGVVLAVVNQSARPVGVTGHVHTREGWVFSFSTDGMIVCVSTHEDVDEARATAERLAQEAGVGVSQNVDTVRQDVDAINAFMHGELSTEAYAERFDPQIEMLWPDRQTLPDFPQHLRGLAEVIAFAEQYRDGWIDLAYELLEVIELPDGRVVALVRQSGRGRQSGVPIVAHFFELCTIRDGKTRRIEVFRHRADALQAAGLEE
jgi:ketosteroid isomerase-like protein